MERWNGKVALVTGASQGMDRSMSAELVKSGMVVYGCARSVNKLEVVVLAPAIIRREGVKLIRKHKIDDGHVINISSMAAHAFPPLPFLHFPSAVKCAIQAITTGLRHELLAAQSEIRVSMVSPGTTDTSAFDQIALLLQEGLQVVMVVERSFWQVCRH